jgi:hypothetical protein
MAVTNIRGAQIKDGDITSDDIANGAVRGATANAGSEREIALGTISDIDLRDDAVTPAKLADTGTFQMGTLRLDDGSAPVPSLSFKNDIDTGSYLISDGIYGVATAGTLRFQVDATGASAALAFNSAAGSITNPSYRFTGDSNTGIYNPSADVVGLVAGGTEVGRWTTGGLQLGVNGTAGAPSLTFSSDPDLGFFRAGTDILGIGTAGVEALRIDASQNVGIGGSTVTSAILSLNTTTKAFLPPRVTTTQRDAISTPTAGMLVFNTTTSALNLYTTSWGSVQAPASSMTTVAGNPGSPAEGDIWYDTITKQFKGKNSTGIIILG